MRSFMKKKMAGLLAAVLAVSVLGGCSKAADTMTNSDLSQMKVEKYVTLGDYDNLTVEVAPEEVTQEQWDQLLLDVYQSNVTAENGAVTNRAVENGDTVIIDYVGKKDGVAFAGGTASGADLVIGSGTFIDGFEEGLIGVMPGKTVDLNLTFPAEYHSADLAGQAVVFTVTVNYILPNITELQDSVVGGFELEGMTTVEELRQYVYDYLQESAAQTYLYKTQDAIMQELMETSTIADLPESFINSYNHVFSENLAKKGAQYGLDGETYSNYFYGMAASDYIALYSEVQARQEVLLQTIANELGMNVDDEELAASLENYARAVGAESVEALLGETYTEDEYRNYFMCEKVMEYLVEKTTVVEPAAAQ